VGLASFYMQEMLGYIFVVFPVYALLRISYLGIRRVRPTVSREVLLATTVMYATGLLSQTLLPHGYYVEDWRLFAKTISSSYRSFNVVPLHTIWSYVFTYNDQVSDWGAVALMNLLANVLLFVPLGFLAPLLRRGKTTLRQVLAIGVATSFTIEAVQFFIGRSADVDDILLNVLGVCIGYLVLAAVRNARLLAPASAAVDVS